MTAPDLLMTLNDLNDCTSILLPPLRPLQKGHKPETGQNLFFVGILARPPNAVHLLVGLADGDDHDAAGFQLLHQWWRDVAGGGRNHDGVKGRVFLPTVVAIGMAGKHVPVAQARKTPLGATVNAKVRRVRDRATWELGGLSLGNTVIDQQTYEADHVFPIDRTSTYCTRNDQRFVFGEAFDYQTGPEGSLVCLFERPADVHAARAGRGSGSNRGGTGSAADEAGPEDRGSGDEGQTADVGDGKGGEA